MFDWIYQFLLSLAAKVFSWFGFSFGAKKGLEEQQEQPQQQEQQQQEDQPHHPSSEPTAADMSNSFSSTSAGL